MFFELLSTIKVSLVAKIMQNAYSCVIFHVKLRGGLATAFDLAAFRLSMIAPVKKSVNHPRTVASMRVMGGYSSSRRF